MIIPDFTSYYGMILLTLIFFVLITGRYFLIAGLFYLIFYTWYPSKFKARKINKRRYPSGQIKKEIKWSLITSVLFSAAGTVTVFLWEKGYTKVYTKIDLYGWWYLPVSLVVCMLLHETYYYWLHRWMHVPAVFRIVHKVHHDSNIASPFTAFSFHPIEGLLQAVFLPGFLMVFPMHYEVIIIQLVIMSFSSVINHLDIEIYPEKSYQLWGRWVIGATHHSLHHKLFKYNYGLYFTFWDKIIKTESPGFGKAMKETKVK